MDSSSHLGNLVLGLIALATLGNLVIQIVGAFRARRQQIEPQPLEVREAPAFALASELARIESDFGRRMGALDSDIRSLRADMTAQGDERRESIEGKIESVRHEVRLDIQGVHSRVDDVLSAVSELKGRFNGSK